jgi:hypothetical protein
VTTTDTEQHPLSAAPSGPPERQSIDASGYAQHSADEFLEDEGGEAPLIGPVASRFLPHPEPVPTVTGTEPLDRLEVDRDTLHLLLAQTVELLRRVNPADDRAAVRTMRGPQVAHITTDSGGLGLVTFAAVPPGEVWILDQVIVAAAAAVTIGGVYDAARGITGTLPFKTDGTFADTAVKGSTLDLRECPLFPGSQLAVSASLQAQGDLWGRLFYRAFRTYGATPSSTWT